MLFLSTSCDRKKLSLVLQDPLYGSLLQTLDQLNRLPKKYKSWADLELWLQNFPDDDDKWDSILKPILRIHQLDRDFRWRTILMVLLWDELAWVQRGQMGRIMDKEDFGSEIGFAFFESLMMNSFFIRSKNYRNSIKMDVKRRVYRRLKREIRRSEIEETAIGKYPEIYYPEKSTAPIVELEKQWEIDDLIFQLKQMVAAEILSKADFHLLVGSLIYGKPLRDWAMENGLTYEAAKKRRQRAATAIISYKKFHK